MKPHPADTLSSGKELLQTIRIHSLDSQSVQKTSYGTGLFPAACRIMCEKGEGDDSVCKVHEALAGLNLKDRFSACSEKTLSLVRKHPVKSLAIAGAVMLVIGRCFFRKP